MSNVLISSENYGNLVFREWTNSWLSLSYLIIFIKDLFNIK